MQTSAMLQKMLSINQSVRQFALTGTLKLQNIATIQETKQIVW